MNYLLNKDLDSDFEMKWVNRGWERPHPAGLPLTLVVPTHDFDRNDFTSQCAYTAICFGYLRNR